MEDATLENARTYYGKVLGGGSDLRTDACATLEPPPRRVRDALAKVHEEVQARYLGCGLVAPDGLEGARILDLGCGAGRDRYVLVQLAGPEGRVTGVDATPEQFAVAVGSLFGIGLATRQANRRTVAGILLSWVPTLPFAVLAGAAAYAAIGRLGP